MHTPDDLLLPTSLCHLRVMVRGPPTRLCICMDCRKINPYGARMSPRDYLRHQKEIVRKVREHCSRAGRLNRTSPTEARPSTPVHETRTDCEPESMETALGGQDSCSPMQTDVQDSEPPAQSQSPVHDASSALRELIDVDRDNAINQEILLYLRQELTGLSDPGDIPFCTVDPKDPPATDPEEDIGQEVEREPAKEAIALEQATILSMSREDPSDEDSDDEANDLGNTESTQPAHQPDFISRPEAQELVDVISYFIMLMHCRFHVPDVAVRLMIAVFVFVVEFVSNVLGPPGAEGVAESLLNARMLKAALQRPDKLQKYAVCPSCHKNSPYDKGQANSALCCHKALYHKGKPKLLYAYRSLKNVFETLYEDSEMRCAAEEWTRELGRASRRATTERYSGFWTGSRWFEDKSSPDSDCAFVDNADCFKITLSIDWFGPHKGRFHAWHSIGALLVRIDNLPRRLSVFDHHCSGVFLLGLLPGPKEVNADQLQPYLQLVVNELKVFDTPGCLIRTRRFPDGRLVRARLHLVVADSPARAKTGGFYGNRTGGPLCAYCPLHTDHLGMTKEEKKLAIAAALDKCKDDRKEHQKLVKAYQMTTAGYRTTVLSQLEYFDPVKCMPPDSMHAIVLGLGKRFWHDFLVDSCKGKTRGIKKVPLNGKLAAAQVVFRGALIPSPFQRPADSIGLPGGGQPTAKQWSTLFRVQLIPALIEIWARTPSGPTEETLPFDPDSKGSSKRPVKRGPKLARDILESALLLCLVIELVDRDLMESEVDLLDQAIKLYNIRQASMLGRGWLTFNSHLSEHIAEFIRQYGSAYNFSAMIFERYNGRLKRNATNGHRGGIAELTMTKTELEKEDTRRLLLDCTIPFARDHFQRYADNSDALHPRVYTTPARRKKKLDASTMELLLAWLNGPSKTVDTNFVGLFDQHGQFDYTVMNDADFVNTLYIPAYPIKMQIAGSGFEGRRNIGNTFVLVDIEDSDNDRGYQHVPAQVIWIFEKSIRLHGVDKERLTLMHLRLLNMVDVATVFDDDFPGRYLLKPMCLSFAKDDEDKDRLERVLPTTSIVSQLAIVPFLSPKGPLLAVKRLM